MSDIVNTPLNLPSFQYKLSKSGGEVCIFDCIRRKYVPLTPEEWVRQHFVNYLIDGLGVPAGLIRVEAALKINGVNHRADIVVYSRFAEPLMVVECKSTDVTLDNKVVNQVCRYNIEYNAPFVLITNGIKHVCIQFNRADGEFNLVQIPTYEQMCSR